ncbi:MAG TPA: PilN domain-containing protein, partial [Sphingomicrobium sp.]|nr:PilN domain-containing protein [Sphingomicrobium sp.]
MAKINLLPWRAERRRVREREFYLMLGGAAAIAVAVFGMWWYWMGLRIDNQESRNSYMKDQIKQLDGQLAEIKELDKTKSKLLARKQIIEQLQASRSQMVHLFDELVKTIPDSVRLASLRQAGDTLTLQGVAQSNASVANYMRNLDNSKWLTHSDLIKTEVKGTDKRNRYEFGVNVKLRPPENAENLDNKAEDATTPPGATPVAPPVTPPHGAPMPSVAIP